MKIGKYGIFRPLLELYRRAKKAEETDGEGEKEFIRQVIVEHLAVVS